MSSITSGCEGIGPELGWDPSMQLSAVLKSAVKSWQLIKASSERMGQKQQLNKQVAETSDWSRRKGQQKGISWWQIFERKGT